MTIDERKRIQIALYEVHQNKLNASISKISFAYLALSIIWNSLFTTLHLPYSRADLTLLIACMSVWGTLLVLNRVYPLPIGVMKFMVLGLVLLTIMTLYFGSGYREAWCFFLVIPMIVALYGDFFTLFFFSILGLAAMIALEVYSPLVHNVFDSIDLSNRILVYIITATISHLLYRKLSGLYMNLLDVISKSADESIEQVVKTFIVSVEAKDSYTFGHSERVSQYAVELASKLPEYKQEPKRLDEIRLMGMLHDIGKINIPEQLLTKPDRLTSEEYDIIKTHPVVGGKMVEKISGLGPMRNGVLYHHERWDGLGYPSGLAGEQIPLAARILAIADAFDAMTSDRAYRRGLSPQEAFNRLYEGSGTQFDPRLIEILSQHQITWLKIYKSSVNEFREFEALMDLI